MKMIKYQFLSAKIDNKPYLIGKQLSYSTEGEELAKAEAYNGEYEIYDDGTPEPTETPSQLDIIEAQVTYTAMMTDTLLEA
jgi:hypothetical protein